MKKPLFTGVLQSGVVVRDLDSAMEHCWEEFGIGPWAVNTLDPSNTTDMVVRGEPQEFALRAATALVGNTQWELIEPLDEDGIYAEHLREYGEGLHHFGFGVEDYDKAMEFFHGKGTAHLLGGTWGTVKSVYWDTRDGLGCISEIWQEPGEGEDFPPPDRVYPPEADSDSDKG
jgi:hypothetical protein